MNTVPIATVKHALEHWQNKLDNRDYKNKCECYQDATLMIFYTVSYLKGYIELLKETGQGR